MYIFKFLCSEKKQYIVPPKRYIPRDYHHIDVDDQPPPGSYPYKLGYPEENPQVSWPVPKRG